MMPKDKSPDTKSLGCHSGKSRVLNMVRQFECKANEANKAKQPVKATVTNKVRVVKPCSSPDSTANQVNLAAKPQVDKSNLSVRSVKSVQSLQTVHTFTRDILKQVRAHYYNQQPNSKSSAWANKVISGLCKGFAVKRPKNGPKKEASAVHSDESGDDLAPMNVSEQSLPSVMDDSASGDTSPHEKEQNELNDLSQYQVFVAHLKSILERVSGFPIDDLGVSFEQYRDLMAQYGLTSDQLLAEQFRLVYEPNVVVVSNNDEAVLLQSQSESVHSASGGSTLAEQARSVKVVSAETYFYPNKITFE